jgi:dihydroorotase-like cyclic amidohydrolase
LRAVALTDALQGKMSVGTFVRLTSENPARIIGRYPQKGAIQPGSDADMAIVEPQREFEPSDERTYSKVGWTPFLGMRLRGAPVWTVRRGEIICRDGKVVGQPGTGRYLAGVAQEPAPVNDYWSPGLAWRPRSDT